MLVIWIKRASLGLIRCCFPFCDVLALKEEANKTSSSVFFFFSPQYKPQKYLEQFLSPLQILCVLSKLFLSSWAAHPLSASRLAASGMKLTIWSRPWISAPDGGEPGTAVDLTGVQFARKTFQDENDGWIFPADASCETALQSQTVWQIHNVSLVLNLLHGFRGNAALRFVCRCFLTNVRGKSALFMSGSPDKDVLKSAEDDAERWPFVCGPPASDAPNRDVQTMLMFRSLEYLFKESNWHSPPEIFPLFWHRVWEQGKLSSPWLLAAGQMLLSWCFLQRQRQTTHLSLLWLSAAANYWHFQ